MNGFIVLIILGDIKFKADFGVFAEIDQLLFGEIGIGLLTI